MQARTTNRTASLSTAHSAGLLALLCAAQLAQVGTAQDVRFRDEVFSAQLSAADVAYGSAWNRWTNATETLLLDVYEPAGDVAAARPAVVVVHGGGFTGGSKSGWRPVAVAEAFARRGYVTVSIDYRVAPGPLTVQQNIQVVTEDASHDLKAAVRWLRSQAGALRVDPDRIASAGQSAGASTVLTGAYSEGEGVSGNPGFSSEVACVIAISGGLLDPMSIEAGEAPVFLVHGTADTAVPPIGSISVHQRALQEGIPTELHLLPGVNHGDAFVTFMSTHLDDAVAFSWEHLGLGAMGGLKLAGPVSAPGTAALQSTGVAGDARWLGVATATQLVPIPGLGDWWLGPAGFVLAPVAPFPAAPRLPSMTTQVAVPMSAAGLDVYFQEVRLGVLTGQLRLSNSVHLDL